MIHPLFHLISTRPHLLAEHVGAYGELAGEELVALTARWRRQAMLTAAGLFGVSAAAMLAGIAAMLWAVVPGAGEQARWVLIGVPALPLIVGAGCFVGARSSAAEPGVFASLKSQFVADMAMLRSVTATTAP